MEHNDIGIIGLSVMGSNLALNMADHGFAVAGYDFSPTYTKKFVSERPHKHVEGFYQLKEFIDSLKKPRRVFLMIKAGAPVDQVIEQLVPFIDPDDIIMDGGNSFFEDTRRRFTSLAAKGIHYFGIGVSGGEQGARNGPALMPGGEASAYQSIQPILEAIAATVNNQPCCTFIGSDGAGHYVKMVHNGIEYADMQLISEAYRLLKYIGGYTDTQISKIFHEWDQGELNSYLVGITADILLEQDDDGSPLVEKILDSAGQKGTGRWTSIEALKQGVDVSIITTACNVRVVSNQLENRKKAAALIQHPRCQAPVDDDFVEQVRQSLYTAKIVAYAQGFSLYFSASSSYGWSLDFGKIASIFRGGCIIRAEFLNKIMAAYEKNPDLRNLIFDDFFLGKINENQHSLRASICQAIQNGLAVPAFSSALQYIDEYSGSTIGANLIQAQRDYFGAHTYERTDCTGSFHHNWKEHYQK